MRPMPLESEGRYEVEHERPISPWPEWRIVEKIGEGSYGKVYKAQRTEEGQSFYSALKVISIPSSRGELNTIRHETSNEDSAREYFRNLVDDCILEVSTMESFRGNSHIVSVEDFKVVEYLDEIGWDIYIRMEFLQSFLEYCTGRTMTERKVIKLGIDICKALEYCGKLRIIHRDIKPENIFVSRFGDFKLGDFGIARELEKSVGTMSKKGTFSYMAPEMYRGDPYDSSVDIYSLGIVLYKLMNRNRLPFMDLGKQLITYRDKENAISRRMNGELLPRPADASPELAEIILRACAYDVRERYQDPEMMRVDLERLRRGEYIAGKSGKVVGRSGSYHQNPENGYPFTDSEAISGTARASEFYDHSDKRTGQYESLHSSSSVAEKEPLYPMLQAGMDEEELWKSLEKSTDVESDYANGEAALEGWQPPPREGLPIWAIVLILAVGIGGMTMGFYLRPLLDAKEEAVAEEIDISIAQKVAPVLKKEKKEKLSEQAKGILEAAQEILDGIDSYEYEGTPEEGIRFFNAKDELVLSIVYTENGQEEGKEFFYNEASVMLAYIWDNSSGEILYYNPEEDLVRWVDPEGNVHEKKGQEEDVKSEVVLREAHMQLE